MINTQQKPKNSIGSKSSLKDVLSPISGEMDEFRVFFKDAIRTDVFLLNRIVNYLLRQKGKQLRPALVLMSARLFGNTNDRSHIAATMIELLHTATLIHDDVVDEADVRRGFSSINKVWNNKAGVLLGDFLLSKGLLIALDYDEYKLLKVLSNAVKKMSEGELRQFKAANLFNMDEEYYFKVISEKTASLIACCCQCGAVSATDDEELHQLMYEIGMDLGIAFQIKDDLFDYGIDDVGKPLRNDIQERKVTLPFIKALEGASFTKRTHIRYLMRKRKKKTKDIETIVSFVHEQGGIEYGQKIMNGYVEQATEKLNTLPHSPARDEFNNLIQFIINRKK